MIEVYEQAKILMPGLSLEFSENLAAVRYNGKLLFDTSGPRYEQTIICYLSGIIVGFNIKKTQ